MSVSSDRLSVAVLGERSAVGTLSHTFSNQWSLLAKWKSAATCCPDCPRHRDPTWHRASRMSIRVNQGKRTSTGITSKELWFSRKARSIMAGNNLLILNRNRFFRQQHEISLLNWRDAEQWTKIPSFIRRATIKENISPSSSQATPPKQNISNHPSRPSRMPKTVWWTSHRVSSTMFFTTFLKILDGWQNDSQAISRRGTLDSYSTKRSCVRASSGNGMDWRSKPRWGRQSSNADLESNEIRLHSDAEKVCL